ncbi:MAG: glycosyltransferase [archaeon]|nr:glycosyltransferase [archaeon]
MKVMLVIDRIMTGGAERILVDYYHYLEKNGHEPYIFALSGNSSQSKWAEGLRVVYGTPGDEDNLVKKTFQQLSLLFKLRRLVKDVKPTVIFSFLEKSNLLTILVPASATKVVSVHNVLSIQYKKIHNKWVRKILYKMIQSAYNHCSNVVAVSKQVKDDLIESFHVNADNVKIINNFVDREGIAQKAMESVDDFCFDSSKKYIMNVGRFSDQKAQWKLIKAFSIYLKDTEVSTELVLIGAGDYAESLKHLATDLGVVSKVHVLPFNVNPYKYMANAHIFALSSIYEGFPIVLAEISSLRIPFVGSRKAVPEEMFDDPIVWNEYVFDSETFEADFSTKIHDDEIALAKLLKKSVEDESYRKNLLQHTKVWESENFKDNQFALYDKLMGLV